jgi:dsRNA-specific ribonuclease
MDIGVNHPPRETFAEAEAQTLESLRRKAVESGKSPDKVTLNSLQRRNCYLRTYLQGIIGREHANMCIGSLPSDPEKGKWVANVWKKAFTHPTKDNHSNYQVLEKVGDRVVYAAFIKYAHKVYPTATESQLAPMERVYLSKDGLSKIANQMGLGQFVERHSEVAMSKSILEDVYEAFAGALVLIGDEIFGPSCGNQLIDCVVEYQFAGRLRLDVHKFEYENILKEMVEQYRWGHLEKDRTLPPGRFGFLMPEGLRRALLNTSLRGYRFPVIDKKVAAEQFTSPARMAAGMIIEALRTIGITPESAVEETRQRMFAELTYAGLAEGFVTMLRGRPYSFFELKLSDESFFVSLNVELEAGAYRTAASAIGPSIVAAREETVRRFIAST